MPLFDTYRQVLDRVQPIGLTGRVSGVRGLTVSVGDFPAPLGSSCSIVSGSGSVEARVIGLAGGQTLVMPMGSMGGITRGDRVRLIGCEQTIGVGPGMLGRVLNAMGKPIDGRGDVAVERSMPLWPQPMGPMSRRRIDQPIGTGIRGIDAMLTIGRGQRMGIFSGSGVGKSVLMGMIGRHTAADVTVIALVGERGGEVRDFVERDLGADGLARAVVVASTGDEPALVRVQAGAAATSIAEFFRDRGLNVLLLMDSLTRLAAAQRQIGLAGGEPPTTKGYTPSVFAMLPQLLERCGRTETGSITGFYTVLVEGDDFSEPVCDAVRAVTDGHTFLSRELAQSGQYPAIDVLQSVSRVMGDVADDEHQAAARRVRQLAALYAQIEDLVNVGAYQAGASEQYDLALGAMPLVRKFMAQAIGEKSTHEQTRQGLLDLCRRIDLLAQRPSRPGRAGKWVKNK